MEQQMPIQDYFCRIGFIDPKYQSQMFANADSQIPRLQTDEQALRQWSAKLAEIRKREQPKAL